MKRLLILALLFMAICVPVALAQRVDPELMLSRQLTADQGLFFALAKDDITSMVVLRDQGANPNTSLGMLGLRPVDVFGVETIMGQNFDPAGWPILHWAVYLDNLEAVKMLIRNGARVNAPDIYGATALHWAAWGGRHSIAKVLLNHGASCRAMDSRRRSAKDWAIMMGQTDMITLLDSRTCRPASIIDSDGDGVPDDQDLCPNTPLGAPVDDRGCWVIAYANYFDFDKSVVKSQYLPMLADAARVMKNYPELSVEVQGHTDAIGTEQYNMGLGKRRAQAVKRVLVRNGVSSSRLNTTSLGESQPIASNSTSSGRARNRRVEVHVAEPGAFGGPYNTANYPLAREARDDYYEAAPAAKKTSAKQPRSQSTARPTARSKAKAPKSTESLAPAPAPAPAGPPPSAPPLPPNAGEEGAEAVAE